MELTQENYFTPDASKHYMSASQYKAFNKCEAAAFAEVNGGYTMGRTKALLVGSYVDAYFEGALEQFKDENPEIFKKDGNLYADYAHANTVVARIEKDDFFMAHMSGEKQRIMTGTIEGVPFKIKMDSYNEGGMIVDLKIMANLDWQFDEQTRKRVPFVEFWGYDIQAAIYQEIERQNSGIALPFFIAAATKESEPDLALISINQEQLDFKIGQVKNNAKRYQAIKEGKENAARCERCNYCRRTRVLSGYIPYSDIGL